MEPMNAAEEATAAADTSSAVGQTSSRLPQSTKERTREQVEVAAEAAGLFDVSANSESDGSRLVGTQLLKFAGQLNSEELRLMEMPREVLDALRSGERCDKWDGGIYYCGVWKRKHSQASIGCSILYIQYLLGRIETQKELTGVVVRGEPGEDAVLCTEGMSYDLRAADTSNALLLVPSLSYSQQEAMSSNEDRLPSKEVTACLSSYFELRPCRPKTGKLRRLLAECPYRGPEYENGGQEFEGGEPREKEEEEGCMEEGEGEEGKTKQRKGKEKLHRKYTFSELLSIVQASERELWDALDKQHACLIDGYWRVLEADYVEQAMQHILTLLEEQDWHWTRIPFSVTCQLLMELQPSFVIAHCLKCYGSEVFNNTEDCTSSTETYFELSEEKVCQFYAVLLLRQAGKFNYNEFMDSWQQSVPLGMNTDLQQLRGLALSDMNTMPPVIWYFPASTLPQETAERFGYLFSMRERWSHSDIEPYIQDLATPSQSLNALLLKHARVSTGVKGQKMYNAKRTALPYK